MDYWILLNLDGTYKAHGEGELPSYSLTYYLPIETFSNEVEQENRLMQLGVYLDDEIIE